MNIGMSPSKARAGTTKQLYKRLSPSLQISFEKIKSKQTCLVKRSSSVTGVGKSKGTKAPNSELQEMMIPVASLVEQVQETTIKWVNSPVT